MPCPPVSFSSDVSSDPVPAADKTSSGPTRGPAPPAQREGRPLRQAGDDLPFDLPTAIADHRAALFLFALNGLGDSAEAEDCVQEAFVRAWRNADRYNSSRGSVRTWMFAIARNLIIDSLRARARRPAPSELEQIEWATEPFSEDMAIVERLALQEHLAALTAEHREVIVAVKLDGVGYQEFSERTGIPVSTLRTRMYYGLRSLRAAMSGDARDDYARAR